MGGGGNPRAGYPKSWYGRLTCVRDGSVCTFSWDEVLIGRLERNYHPPATIQKRRTYVSYMAYDRSGKEIDVFPLHLDAVKAVLREYFQQIGGRPPKPDPEPPIPPLRIPVKAITPMINELWIVARDQFLPDEKDPYALAIAERAFRRKARFVLKQAKLK